MTQNRGSAHERAEAAEAAALERLREAMAREARGLLPLTPAEAAAYREGFHDGQDAASEDRIERLLALIADVLVGSTPAGKKADEYAARLAAIAGEPAEPREGRPRSRQEQEAHDFLEDLKANPEMVRDLARGHELGVEPPGDEPRPGFCGLCGQPMPPGEEMFRYHGLSGPCPNSGSALD